MLLRDPPTQEKEDVLCVWQYGVCVCGNMAVGVTPNLALPLAAYEAKLGY